MGNAARRCSASASRYLRTASSRSPVRSLLGLVTEARVSTEPLEAEARCSAAGVRGETTGVRPDPEGASSSSEDSTSPSHCEIRRLEAAFDPTCSALARRAMPPYATTSRASSLRGVNPVLRYLTRSDGGRSVNSASSARIAPLMFPSGDQRRDDASTRAREHTSSVDDASRRHLGGRLPLVLGAAEGCHGHAMRSLVLSAMPPRVVGPEGDVPFVPHSCH